MKRSELYPDLELPEITFGDREGSDSKQVKIVSNVLKHYSIIKDITTGIIYKYNGRYWEEIAIEQLNQFLVRAAVSCGVSYVQAASLKFRTQLTDLMLIEASTRLNQDHTAFNLNNGVLVFNPDGTVSFSEHDPERHFTYILDYDYDPKAKCQRFDQFLNRVVPNEESQRLLFAYVASVFRKDIQIERMLFLIGSGANGKSTILSVVEALFGQACVNTTLTELTNKNPETAHKAAFGIHNKLIAVSHEDKGIIDQELYKKIASKNSLKMRKLFRDTFESTNYARLIIGMNSKPRVEANTGSRRRFVAIPMDVTIPVEERDPELNQKLRLELSGILNKLIRAHAERVNLNHLSDTVETFSEEIMSESDPIVSWTSAMSIRILKYDPGMAKPKETKLDTISRVYKVQVKDLELYQAGELYTSRDNISKDDVETTINYLFYCRMYEEHFPLGFYKFHAMLKSHYGEPTRFKGKGPCYIITRDIPVDGED